MATAEGHREHIDYFDYLRFFAALGVIFMHTAAELLRGERNAQWEVLNLCTSLAFTAVPLFLMMSGYLILSGEKTMDVGVLLKKRLPRLAVPLAAWTVIEAVRALLAQGALTPRALLSSLVRAFNDPAAIHFWYMYLLLALYAVSPILCGGLRALDRKGHLYVLALIGLVLLQTMANAVLPARFDKFVTFDILGRLRLFGGHLCAFLLGYYLGNWKRRIPNSLLVILSAALLGFITLATRWLTARDGGYVTTFQDQSGGFEVALAACIFLLFRQNAKPARFFKAIPVVPLFLPIYLMHGLLLAVVQSFGVFPHSFWAVMGMTAANFILCFLVAKTAATIKPICFLLTGIPYANACNSCNWVYTYRRLRGR